MELNKKINPITIRSKKWIVNSLLELMNEKPYKDITIKEISERADLVRQTIYRNFRSKEAILEHYVDDKYKDFINLISNKKEISLHDLLVTYFEFMENNRGFLKKLIDNNIYSVVLDLHLKYIKSVNKNSKFIQIFSEKNDINILEHFSAGGLWFILKKWIDDGINKSPREMADMVLNLYNITNVNFNRI